MTQHYNLPPGAILQDISPDESAGEGEGSYEIEPLFICDKGHQNFSQRNECFTCAYLKKERETNDNDRNSN